MIRRLLPHPLLTLFLAAVWLLLANSLSTGDVLIGLLLGWVIPFYTRDFWPERVTIRRPLTLARFILTVLRDIVVANFVVAGLILRGPAKLKPTFLRLRLDLQSDLVIGLLANTICLTPGTVAAELSLDRRYLLIHVLNTDDPEALLRTIRQRYEAPLKEVFES